MQTELSLSTLNFPMEAVCLKRTLIREGFELSSAQCGQLEAGDRLTVIEGLEGQMGHNTILRVRFDRGWVLCAVSMGSRSSGHRTASWRSR